MNAMNLSRIGGAIAGLSLLASAQTTTIVSAKQAACVWLASDVVGMRVESPTGEKLGKVEDIVVHPGGEVAYAVLSFGGTLGMGDKLFAMPWSVLRAVEPESSKKNADPMLVLPLDKERLKNAPGFNKDNWPVMANSDWAKDIDAYYISDTKIKRTVEASARSSFITWKASELKGTNVNTPTNEKLGDIKDIAIDTGGRVSYAVISVGGFLGIGDKLVAVPWDALRFSLEGDKGNKKAITLSATKKQLENAPEFKADKDRRKDMCNPTWIGEVYTYYSVKPYWTVSESGDSIR